MSAEVLSLARQMAARLMERLTALRPTILLYGSVPLGDFRPGWSDIDLLCLTASPLPEDALTELVMLRQQLVAETGEPRFRLFEGLVMPVDNVLRGADLPAVYWGTSGQRVRTDATLDSFCLWELRESSLLLAGPDLRPALPVPSRQDFRREIARHLTSIRRCAAQTGRSLYSYGWLLDIARGLYTLETGQVTSKRSAGEWALARGLCPDPPLLRLTLAIRYQPALFDLEAVGQLSVCLGDAIQRFADVLERALAAS